MKKAQIAGYTNCWEKIFWWYNRQADECQSRGLSTDKTNDRGERVKLKQKKKNHVLTDKYLTMFNGHVLVQSLRKIYEWWNLVFDLIFLVPIMVYNLFSVITCIQSVIFCWHSRRFSSRIETWEWTLQTYSWNPSLVQILSFYFRNVC